MLSRREALITAGSLGLIATLPSLIPANTTKLNSPAMWKDLNRLPAEFSIGDTCFPYKLKGTEYVDYVEIHIPQEAIISKNKEVFNTAVWGLTNIVPDMRYEQEIADDIINRVIINQYQNVCLMVSKKYKVLCYSWKIDINDENASAQSCARCDEYSIPKYDSIV